MRIASILSAAALRTGAATCALILLAACGGGNQAITPPAPIVQAGPTYQAAGSISTADGQSGSLQLSFAASTTTVGPAPVVLVQAATPMVPNATSLGGAQGLLTLGSGPGIVMAGTFNPVNGALALAGGGYTYSASATFTTGGALESVSGELTTTATGAPGAPSLLTAGVPDAHAGTFTATGAMGSVRERHTATLLNNGLVLIAGGGAPAPGNTFVRLASAELYSPAPGTFSSTGNMVVGTEEHTATLLPDGTVLIIGGRDNNNQAIDRIERYDPATGQFTLQNSLNHARLEYHTATLLPDGKVLVAGGASQPGGKTDTSVAIAEIYDPNATNGPNPARLGKSTDTGSMVVPRGGHMAMLHPADPNRVLIFCGFAGGENGNSVATPESYDIAAGTFSAMTTFDSTKRGGAAVAYLGGLRWLFAGGFDFDTSTILASARIVDGNLNAGAGGLLTTGSLPGPRFTGSTSATWPVRLLDGRVLIAGGITSLLGTANAATAVVFDPAGNSGAGTFSTTNNMSSSRTGHTSTMLPNGRVLITGGMVTNDLSAVSSADLYHP